MASTNETSEDDETWCDMNSFFDKNPPIICSSCRLLVGGAKASCRRKSFQLNGAEKFVSCVEVEEQGDEVGNGDDKNASINIDVGLLLLVSFSIFVIGMVWNCERSINVSILGGN